MAKYNIGGYIFNEEESAKKAAKELKNVEYILAQLKDADEKAVLQVYKKLLSQRLFSTEIGMGFLNQLRQNLIASGAFSDDEVPEVYSLEKEKKVEETQSAPEQVETEPASAENTEAVKDSKTVEKPKVEPVKKKVKVKEKKVVAKSESYQVRRLKIINGILIMISVTLLLCIIGMFYVNSTINSPTILNYQESITDEYSQWKQELEAKEAELKEREKALEERENGQ